jgi:hypothetical protein
MPNITHLSKIWMRGRRSGTAQPVYLSCIGTAELILKTDSVVFKEPIFAYFGGGVSINISDAENFHVGHSVGGDFTFTRMPVIGEGIMLLRKTASDKAGVFNMHFGAVVRMWDNGSVDISDNSAEFGRSEKNRADLQFINIRDVRHFYGSDYNPTYYYMGLLCSNSGSQFSKDPGSFAP